MESATIAKVVVGVVLVLLQLLGWLLALGGVGKLHDDCNVDNCSELFRASWWSIFFQLFVLIFTGLVVVTKSLESARIPVIAFLVLSTVELMDEAEKALQLSDMTQTGLSESAINAAAAGFVLMSLFNFVLIVLLGVAVSPDMEWLKAAAAKLRSRQGEQGQAQAGAAAAAPAPAPATAPPVVVDLKAMDQGVQPQGPATLPVAGEKMDGGVP